MCVDFFFFFRIAQTIKCLLIVPNAESALNEEAGKLLLEQYDDYSKRARMMTEIHAQPATSKSSAQQIDADSTEDDGPLSKKHALDKRALDKKKEKLMKEKKKILKRLWDDRGIEHSQILYKSI